MFPFLLQLSIGRGHPNYLNLLKKELNIPYYYYSIPLKRPIIRFLNLVYKNSSKNHLFLSVYNKLRKKGKVPNFLIEKIKKEIEKFLPKESLIIVSHPILAKALEDKKNIYYLHGEISFPKEAICKVKKIFVPLNITKEEAKTYGIEEKNISVTNLFIEKELTILKELGFKKRMERLEKKERLSCAFFLSGAYPKPHINKILEFAKFLTLNNIKVFLFSINYSYYLFFQRKLFPYGVYIIKCKDWQDEIKRLSEIFLSLDFFIAASHERTNWALGLSLPMFVLTPFIGSYATQNYEIAKNYGVCLLLDELKNLNLYERLKEMNECCYNSFLIDGAKNTAEIIKKDIFLSNNLS